MTLLRRKFIPPLCESYQDILVMSQFYFPEGKSELMQEQAAMEFLTRTHQQIVNTCHFN